MNLRMVISTINLDESSRGDEDILACRLMHKNILKRYCNQKMVSFPGVFIAR
jgi:hypothetical protein